MYETVRCTSRQNNDRNIAAMSKQCLRSKVWTVAKSSVCLKSSSYAKEPRCLSYLEEPRFFCEDERSAAATPKPNLRLTLMLAAARPALTRALAFSVTACGLMKTNALFMIGGVGKSKTLTCSNDRTGKDIFHLSQKLVVAYLESDSRSRGTVHTACSRAQLSYIANLYPLGRFFLHLFIHPTQIQIRRGLRYFIPMTSNMPRTL